MKYDGTADCAAEIAEDVCRLFANGERGIYTYNKFPFELTDIARCSEFVRECCDASTGKWLPYFGGTARETEQILKREGKKVATPKRGDIVCFNNGNAGIWGHIGLCLGDGLYAENTSSKERGPGFVISKLSEVASRISGYYSILPARKQQVNTTPVKVVKHSTGAVLATYNMVNGGNHIADQKKLYVK